ncbi:MAG: phage terminase large subunit family protein [bacterium]|nr:phage terminase large subunit family protein [bacterium]
MSEWADQYRILSRMAAAEGGALWRTLRTPYLREPMDCLSATHPVTDVTLMTGAQIGKTETANNWIGYIIHLNPGPTMLVAQDKDAAAKNSRTRVDPLIRESEVLSSRVASPRSKDGGNSVLTKEFPGGFLVMVGAQAPSGLSSTPIRYLLMDEVDRFKGDVGGEGDPTELAEARTQAFPDSKVLRTSTPTIEGFSRIAQSYDDGDQRLYYVPCPECGEMQMLSNPKDPTVWQRLRWDEGNPHSARYYCVSCGVAIHERFKPQMLARGEWRAQNPDAPKHVRSYHLSSLYSPWLRWHEIAAKWEKAQGKVLKLKTFLNTVLGVPWKEDAEVPNWKRLRDRRESYRMGTVPKGGVLLTAGGDVQADRIELEVVAWGREMETWSVAFFVLYGDTSGDEVWRELDDVLARTFDHELGGKLMIERVAIDANYNTGQVWAWARGKDRGLVMPIIGRAGAGRPILSPPTRIDVMRSGKKIRSGLKSWIIGVDTAKAELYGWLRQVEPDDPDTVPYGWCHFPEYDDGYFQQLTAQVRVRVDDPNGFQKLVWKLPSGKRDEALDCRVYNRAAAVHVGIDRFTDKKWQAREEALGAASPTPKSKAASTRKRGASYLRGGKSRWD